MTTHSITQTDADVIESLVDKYGLERIVAGLALLCFEKAEHVRSNWQDVTGARGWDADGKRLETVAMRLDN
jgi:hypothetical protein